MSHPVHGKCHKTRQVIKQADAHAYPKPQKTQSEKDYEKIVRENKKKYGI